jgi:hypothetical protein
VEVRKSSCDLQLVRLCEGAVCVWSQCRQTFLNWNVESLKRRDRLPGTHWWRSAKKLHVLSTLDVRLVELISGSCKACRHISEMLYPSACLSTLYVLSANFDFCEFLSVFFNGPVYKFHWSEIYACGLTGH